MLWRQVLSGVCKQSEPENHFLSLLIPVVPQPQNSVEKHLDLARQISDHVRSDLQRAGFIYNNI